MKILYDISVLGVGYYNSLGRTGVFRVVDNLAYRLANSQECDLTFCATGSFQTLNACLDYLNYESKFIGIPFPHSSFMKIFYRKLLDLKTMLNINSKISKDSNYEYLLTPLMKYLDEASNLIENYSYLLEPKSLAEANIFHTHFSPIPEQIRCANYVKSFLTVYDLIAILYPEFFGGIGGNNFLKEVLHSVTQDDWTICISNATKNDLCNYLNIDPSRVFVTHLAASADVFYPCSDSDRKALVRGKYHIPDGFYLLSLSTLEPRKNIDHVIRCFAKIVQEQRLKELNLVLVGAKGWDYDKIGEAISNCDLPQNRIIFTGYVADEDLSALYSGALAFIYPSFYEGFGLPPLEAMQCGVPVITSNTSSLPEVVGDAGIMLDPIDADGLCQSILEIYNRPSLRDAMSLKSLERAKQFSWEKCTQETIAAYQTALSS